MYPQCSCIGGTRCDRCQSTVDTASATKSPPSRPEASFRPIAALTKAFSVRVGDPLDDAISPEAVWRRAIRLLRLRTTASHAT